MSDMQFVALVIVLGIVFVNAKSDISIHIDFKFGKIKFNTKHKDDPTTNRSKKTKKK